MGSILKKTTKAAQKIALKSLKSFEQREREFVKMKKNKVALRIQESEENIEIPLEAFEMLKSILTNMAKGKSIALLLADSELSTQQVAEILNASRPHVVKLLEQGEIPYQKVGSHRRVKLNDLLLYQAKLKKERRNNLDFLAQEAQGLSLGYE